MTELLILIWTFRSGVRFLLLFLRLIFWNYKSNNMTKRKIKVSVWRMFRWINRKLEKKIELTESQKMGMRIFDRTVSIKDAEIFLSPLSDSIYVEVNDIYIILEGSDLQIINGKFRYDLHYPDSNGKFRYDLHYPDSIRSKMRNKILNILEYRRIEVEKRIKTKSDRTLNSILDEVEVIRKDKGQ